MEKKKKKKLWKQWIAGAFFMLIGAICGVLIVFYMDSNRKADRTSFEEVCIMLVLIFIMYCGVLVQMIIHEAGHLVFGLATGYRFSSFRIMNFMWLKENGKIQMKHFSLAGTGGQCLMAPPDMEDGKIPVVLYNLGGSIMNIAVSVLFLIIYFITAEMNFLTVTLLMFSVIGFIVGIMNGVPMRLGVVDNDGYNAYSLAKNDKALRSFWIQMKVQEQNAKGIRLKDMPDEWFCMPADDEIGNSMVAAIGVFACNRLMDMQDFGEANKKMRHLLEMESGIAGIYRNLLICDRMYCELLDGNKETAAKLFTKEQQKFMKSMKKFPSVLRTEYTYALLCKSDSSKAEEIKVKFEKCARTYPYPCEINAERELMCLADRQKQ